MRILKSAHKFFRKYGYSKTTVTDIAEDLEMSTANIYKFYPSKNGLIEAYAASRFDELAATLTKIAKGKLSAGARITNFAEQLYWFHKDLFRNERQVYAMIILGIAGKWKCTAQFRGFMFELVTNLILEGIKTKEFKPTDAPAQALILLDSLLWIIHPLFFPELKASEVKPKLHAQMRFLTEAMK